MLFRQLFDATSSTYTYLIADEQSRQAMIIDPVLEQAQRDLNLIKELQLDLNYTIETHVHADHITAAYQIKSHTGCKIVCPAKAGTTCADVTLKDGDELQLQSITLKAISTPGHTDCSTSYLIHPMHDKNNSLLLTGDTLLIRGCGRTDFQNGSAKDLYDSVTKKLFTLADATLVFPAHDYKGFTCTTIGEEKKYNPRLANKSLDEFIEIMNHLNLSSPKLMDVAVPANRKCGKQ